MPGMSSDAEVLRERYDVLSDPTRLRLLDALLMLGEANATTLTRAVPSAKGAVPWQMGRLEAVGLAEVVRVDGTRKVWRARDPEPVEWAAAMAEDPQLRLAVHELERVVTLRRMWRMQRWAADRELWPREWVDAAISRDYLLWLTPTELDQLDSRLHAAVEAAKEPSNVRPDDAEPVFISLTGFPVRAGD